MVIKYQYINTALLIVIGCVVGRNTAVVNTQSEFMLELANSHMVVQRAVLNNQKALITHNEALLNLMDPSGPKLERENYIFEDNKSILINDI